MNISKAITKYVGTDKIAHFGLYYAAADIMIESGVYISVVVILLLTAGAIKEKLDTHNSLAENMRDMTANILGMSLSVFINVL